MDNEIQKLAEELYQEKSVLIMGRGYHYATCLEGALVSPNSLTPHIMPGILLKPDYKKYLMFSLYNGKFFFFMILDCAFAESTGFSY